MMQPKPATLARVYAYLLGDMRYFPADQAAAEALTAVLPQAPLIARASRAYVRRAVAYVAGQGVRRFLDIGSGVPTQVNVHDIVDTLVNGGQVVYMDVDPVAVGAYQELLDEHPSASAICGDLTDPQTVLDQPPVLQLLDGTEPVAVVLAAVLHFLPDQTAYPAVADLVQALPAGSYLIVSHASPPHERDDACANADEISRICEHYTGVRLHLRRRNGVARFLHGLELVEPGLVWLPQWRPDPADPPDFAQPDASAWLVGVGRKPATTAVARAPATTPSPQATSAKERWTPRWSTSDPPPPRSR